MASREKLAKKNLKKSLVISGVIVTGAASAGFAVSIPVYARIQKSLIASKSKLSDLSSLMYQLVNKLGVSPDASFQKQLSGGYVLTYSNGKTKVFKTVNGHQVLIVNMNNDNTIGSASTKDGVAAQTMLSVLTEAEHLFKTEENAMKDIINEYASETEKESLEIESAITGESADIIKLRNAMSDNNILRKEAAIKKLTENMNANDIAEAKKRAKEIIDAEKRAEDKRLERIRKMKAAEAKGKAALIAERARQKIEKEKEIKEKEDKLLKIEVSLLTAKKTRMKNWIKSRHHEINVNDIPDEIIKLTALYNKLQEIDIKRDMNEVITEQGARRGNRNIIDMLSTSFYKWVPFYIKVHNGYLKKNGEIGKKSPMAETLMKKRLLSRGLSESKYEEITRWANKVVAENGGASKVKISFKEIINNYNDKNYSISRVSVIKVVIENGVRLKNYLVLSRSTIKSNIGVEKIRFFDKKNDIDTLEKITVLASLSERTNGYLDLTKKLVEILNNISSIPVLPKNNIYEELLKIYNLKNKIIDDDEKRYVGTKIHILLKKYILELQPININGTELIKYIHALYFKDKNVKKNASLDPRDPLFSIAPKVGWKDLMDKFINSTNINKIDEPKNMLKNIPYFNQTNKEIRDYVVHINFKYVFAELSQDNGSGPRLQENSVNYNHLTKTAKEMLLSMPTVLIHKFFRTNYFFTSFKTIFDTKGSFRDLIFRTEINNLIKMSDNHIRNASLNIKEIEKLNNYKTYIKFLELLESNQYNKIITMITMDTNTLTNKIKPRIEYFLKEYAKLGSTDISTKTFNEIIEKIFDINETTSDVKIYINSELTYYTKIKSLWNFLYTKPSRITHLTADSIINNIKTMQIIPSETKESMFKTFKKYIEIIINNDAKNPNDIFKTLFYNMSNNMNINTIKKVYRWIITFNKDVAIAKKNSTINKLSKIPESAWPSFTWQIKKLRDEGRPFEDGDLIASTTTKNKYH